MISEIEDYFAKGCGRCERFATSDCSTRFWSAELDALRRICLEAGLVETVKWGHPCYMHAGRNVVILGALRGDVRISFFYPALMSDPDNVLVKQGPNTRFKDAIRFTGIAQIEQIAPVLRSYLVEAMGYAEAGILPRKEEASLDLPAELAETLEADSALAEAFWRLTPGRRRSFVINISSAKNAETRLARIQAFRPRIMAGKGATER